jgi:hypothetical protein
LARITVFNSTFNNISVISFQSVVLVEETGENHRPAASHWHTLSHNVVSSTLRKGQDSTPPEIVILISSLYPDLSSYMNYNCIYNISNRTGVTHGTGTPEIVILISSLYPDISSYMNYNCIYNISNRTGVTHGTGTPEIVILISSLYPDLSSYMNYNCIYNISNRTGVTHGTGPPEIVILI